MSVEVGSPTAQRTVVTGVTAIDPASASVHKDMSIVIQHGVIQRLAASSAISVSASDAVVNASGCYAIPGLIDSHVHYRDWVPELFITHGVTSVRDTGNELAWILSQKNAESMGLLDHSGQGWFSRSGPRIFVAAVMNTKPNGKGHHYVVSTVDEARTAVEFMVRRGVDAFKLHNGTSAEVARMICEEAHNYGLKVSAHPGERLSVAEGIEAGLDCIEHSLQFTDQFADRALDVVEEMAARGVYWCPTVTLDESMIYPNPPGWGDVLGIEAKVAEAARNLVRRDDLSYLPKDWVDVQLAAYPDGGRPPTKDTARVERFEFFRELVRTYVEAGGRLLCGSDATFVSIAGFVMHEELHALVNSVGMRPMDALRAATTNGAEYVGRNDVGRVAVGAGADIVLLEADPLVDIRNTWKIRCVFKAGRQVDLDYHADFVQLLQRPVLPGSPVLAQFMLER